MSKTMLWEEPSNKMLNKLSILMKTPNIKLQVMSKIFWNTINGHQLFQAIWMRLVNQPKEELKRNKMMKKDLGNLMSFHKQWANLRVQVKRETGMKPNKKERHENRNKNKSKSKRRK